MTIKIINDLLLKSAYVSQFPTENQFQKGIKDTNVNVQVHVYYLCKALPKRTNCSIIFSLLICSPRYYVKRPSTNKCFFLNKYLTVTMLLFLYGPIPASFCLFSPFSHHKLIANWKSVDGVLGIRTWAAGWKAHTKPRSYGSHNDHVTLPISRKKLLKCFEVKCQG